MNTENKSFTEPCIKDLWQTPARLFEKLNDEFNFTCDIASSDQNHFCDDWLTEDDDALSYNICWGGVNWCNPPYSNISPWVDAAILKHKQGLTTVMLVPSDTSVKWFKKAFDTCTEARFISGRISFINAATQKPVSGNNKGSVLFIWRGNCPAERAVTLVDREYFGL